MLSVPSFHAVSLHEVHISERRFSNRKNPFPHRSPFRGIVAEFRGFLRLK